MPFPWDMLGLPKSLPAVGMPVTVNRFAGKVTVPEVVLLPPPSTKPRTLTVKSVLRFTCDEVGLTKSMLPSAQVTVDDKSETIIMAMIARAVNREYIFFMWWWRPIITLFILLGRVFVDLVCLMYPILPLRRG